MRGSDSWIQRMPPVLYPLIGIWALAVLAWWARPLWIPLAVPMGMSLVAGTLHLVSPGWAGMGLSLLVAAVPAIHLMTSPLAPWRRWGRLLSLGTAVAFGGWGWWWCVPVGILLWAGTLGIPRLGFPTVEVEGAMRKVSVPSVRPRITALAYSLADQQKRAAGTPGPSSAARNRILPKPTRHASTVQSARPDRPVDGPGMVVPEAGTPSPRRPEDLSPIAAIVWGLLADAGDAGLSPIALYGPAGISRSAFFRLRRDSPWIVPAGDGRYRLGDAEAHQPEQQRVVGLGVPRREDHGAMDCPTCGEELARLSIDEREPWFRCTSDPNHEFEVGRGGRLVPLPPQGTMG